MSALTWFVSRNLSLVPTRQSQLPQEALQQWEQLSPPMRSSLLLSSPISPVREEQWVWPMPASPPFHLQSPLLEDPPSSPHLWVQRTLHPPRSLPYCRPTPPSFSPFPVLHPCVNIPAARAPRVRSPKQKMKKRVRNALRESVSQLGAQVTRDLWLKEMDCIGLLPEGPCPSCINGGWRSTLVKCGSIIKAHLCHG